MDRDLRDMWDAMKNVSYVRALENLEKTIKSYSGDDSEIINLCLEKACKLLDVKAGTFWLYHVNDDGLIKPAAFIGGSDISGFRLFPNEGIVGKVIASGEPVILEDVNKETSFANRVDKKTGFVTKTMICVPTVYKEYTFGCIQLINKEDDDLFDERDLNLAKEISNKIVEILKQANLIDSFIPNNANAKIEGSNKGDILSLTCAYVDISGFKKLASSISIDKLTNVVNSFIMFVSGAANKYDGIYNKLLGDKILVYWNDDKGDSAVKACKAALYMMENLSELQHTINTKYGADINIRIGIHYGEAYVGGVGFTNTYDKEIIGEVVIDTAAITTRTEKGDINISREVYEKAYLKNDVQVLPLKDNTLKDVEVYKLISIGE